MPFEGGKMSLRRMNGLRHQTALSQARCVTQKKSTAKTITVMNKGGGETSPVDSNVCAEDV